ncbi:MAG: polysaccharide biosynthesis C-terminal domain-containing protein [Flavobacteriales bacterium]|nr:polysaccharide biosynthesis C-terminal domain-containing protein [Flavobacteriales bacterium]
MQRKFITNLVLLLLLNLLIKPFWIFGVDRTVQNLVDPELYGTYFALFNFSMLFNILLDLGITSYNNRNIAQNHHLLSYYFSGIASLKFLLGVFYMLLTFAIGYVVGYESERFYMLLFLCINQFLISFLQYLRSNISGLQLYTLDSLLSVLDKSLMIAICSFLLWGNMSGYQFELMHFVYGQTVAYATAFVVIFFIVLAKSKTFDFKLKRSFILEILKQTFPYALLILTMTFYYRLDAIMLDLMLEDGERQSSIYAQSYRLMDASTQIGVLFAGLLLPMFANMIKHKQAVDSLVKLSFSWLFVPSVILAIFSFTFSDEIMEILYVQNTGHAAQVLGVLMICFIAISTTYIFGTLLTANGSLKLLNKLAISGMLLNFTLNMIFIPEFKAVGSAYASLITQFLIVIIQIIAAKKLFAFQFNSKFIITLSVYLMLLLVLAYLVNTYLSEFTHQFIVFVGVSGVLALVTRIIDLKKVYKILINREV